jgi:hypothetical protein
MTSEKIRIYTIANKYVVNQLNAKKYLEIRWSVFLLEKSQSEEKYEFFLYLNSSCGSGSAFVSVVGY